MEKLGNFLNWDAAPGKLYRRLVLMGDALNGLREQATHSRINDEQLEALFDMALELQGLAEEIEEAIEEEVDLDKTARGFRKIADHKVSLAKSDTGDTRPPAARRPARGKGKQSTAPPA